MTEERESPVILVVDDFEDSRYALERILLHSGYRVSTAASGAEALELARTVRPSAILLDVMMPGMNGYEAAQHLKADAELRYIPLILVTAKNTLPDIVKGLDAGADDYIAKPFKAEELLARLRAALRLRGVYEELRTTSEARNTIVEELGAQYGFHEIVGKSPAMVPVFELLRKVTGTDAPVLVTGASGTGKELVARAVHFNSQRRRGPFVARNCAAFNENLLESELFGHARGAFTGAIRDQKGIFESADGGTLFLDEVSEMSASLQAKLLRVIQEGVIVPVGSNAERRVNVRIIGATNKDLEKLAGEGKFREDLLFRLNVINVRLPALADRREDIPLIADHFLQKYAGQRGQRPKRLSADALEFLCRYSWRGNVRELQNELERMIILCGEAEELSADFLSPNIIAGGGAALVPGAGAAGPKSLRDMLADVERREIRKALERNQFNRSRTAKELGMSRSSLLAKLDEYGLAVLGPGAKE